MYEGLWWWLRGLDLKWCMIQSLGNEYGNFGFLLFSSLILHAIFEDHKFVFRQKFLHGNCRILNVYESGHKYHLIWTYNEQVISILVKLVKTVNVFLHVQNEHENDSKWKSDLNETCRGLKKITMDIKITWWTKNEQDMTVKIWLHNLPSISKQKTRYCT